MIEIAVKDLAHVTGARLRGEGESASAVDVSLIPAASRKIRFLLHSPVSV